MQYNSYCLDEQNTEALCLNKAAASNLSQSNIVGKAPSMNGLMSSAVRLGNGSPIRGGHFVMERYKQITIDCIVCGKEFIAYTSKRKFCSDYCKYLYRYQSSQDKEKNCAVCGKVFKTGHLGHKTCSDECTKELAKRHQHTWRVNHRFEIREKDNREVKLKLEHNPIMSRICLWCGELFIPDNEHPYQKYCKELCRDRAGHRERNQRKRTNIHVPYSRWEIFQRDNFTCHICKTLIDMDAIFPMPYSPTIDHVIPIKHGGADALDNVKTAHLICNLKKSDRMNYGGGIKSPRLESAQRARPSALKKRPDEDCEMGVVCQPL